MARLPKAVTGPDNRELAVAIWGESRDPRRTLVEAYLRSRLLELPDEAEAAFQVRFILVEK